MSALVSYKYSTNVLLKIVCLFTHIANNEKPKNNENTRNNRNINEAQQNYASNDQEQQWSSIKPTTSQYLNNQTSYQNNNNTRSWKHPPYNKNN